MFEHWFELFSATLDELLSGGNTDYIVRFA